MKNKGIKGIQASLYVSSWIKNGGTLEKGRRNGASGFKHWLQLITIKGEFLTRDEINTIYTYAVTGNRDLENIAKGYLGVLKD